jgi:predicted amidophosphoribosyltransferase
VRKLVAAWKERGLRGLAGEAASVVAANLPRPTADVLTFVPPDASRRLERGHHPAERLAQALAARWEMPCERRLRRARPSRRQRGLSLAERRRNVAQAFAADLVRGTVVLVDDVYTTGATASAAASALRAAGARRVEVVTLARAVRTAGLGLGPVRWVPI